MDEATNELYTKIGKYDKRIRPFEKSRPVGVKEKFKKLQIVIERLSKVAKL